MLVVGVSVHVDGRVWRFPGLLLFLFYFLIKVSVYGLDISVSCHVDSL